MKTLEIKPPGEPESADTKTIPVHKTGGIGSLNYRDLIQGAIVAAITPALVMIEQSIDAGSLAFHPKSLALASLGGFVAYLLKNLFKPAQVIIQAKELTPTDK